MKKKINLLFPPSHRVLHWCTRAVATLLPNTQRSRDTPTATGDTNPVLKGKKTPQGDATEFGESGAEREPQPCTSGRRTAATPAARTRELQLGEEKRPESLGAALPLPQGGSSRASIRGGRRRLLCPHRRGRRLPREAQPRPDGGEGGRSRPPGAFSLPTTDPLPAAGRAPSPAAGRGRAYAPAPTRPRMHPPAGGGPAPGRALSPFPHRRSAAGPRGPRFPLSRARLYPPTPPASPAGSGRLPAG